MGQTASNDRDTNRRNVGLNEAAIIATALAIVRRDGLRKLTMRALAEELGVTPMATYHYIADKRTLVRLVADAVVAETSLPPQGTLDWKDWLWSLTKANHQAISHYPGLAEFLQNTDPTPAGRRQQVATLDVLRNTGFTEHQARLAYSAVYAYMLGRLAFATQLEKRSGQSPRRSTSDRLTLDDLGSMEHVEFGFRALVTGIEQAFSVTGEPLTL